MRPFLGLAVLAGALAAAACSDGATDPDFGELSRAESVQLATMIGATGSSAVALPTASRSRLSPPDGPAASAAAQPNLSVTTPCPLGGSVTTVGDLVLRTDEATQSGSITTEALVTHHACRVQLERGVVTLSGDPGLTLTSEFAWTSGQQAQPLRVTQAGGFAWTRESGESGTCRVNLVTVSDLATRRRTVQGTLCGFEIREESTWDPAAG